MVTRCIVLVMGIPGVGKSTLIRALLATEMASETFTHIEFDSLYNADVQGGGGFSPQQWKSTREKMLSIVQSKFSDSDTPVTVIVDDNFQYRSMRLQYARLAAECSASFCTIYMRCDDLSLAKRMNESRSGSARVPDPIIDTIHAVLETPDPARYPWEENVYVVDVKGMIEDRGIFENHIQSICSWLRSVSESTVVLTKQVEVPEYLRVQSREANMKSEKHQFDLWSRKVISSLISSASPNMKGSIASICTTVRKKYLSYASFDDGTKNDFLRELTDEINKLK